LADQVDLEFRVVIPARQFVGVVMFEPAKTVFRLGRITSSSAGRCSNNSARLMGMVMPLVLGELRQNTRVGDSRATEAFARH